MSKAFKCDRCKKCFDPFDTNEPGYFSTIREWVTQSSEQFGDSCIGYRDEEIHLCKDCSLLFTIFMSGIANIAGPVMEKDGV